MINLFQLAGGAVLADLPDTVTLKFRTRSGLLGGACGSIFAFSENLCMVIIVDCRRGLGNLDLLLLDGFVARPVLVILSKADKINREKLILAQREAEKNAERIISVRRVLPFSATKKTGVAKARAVLSGWISRD